MALAWESEINTNTRVHLRSAIAQFAALILVLLPAFMADAPPAPVLALFYAAAGLLLLGCAPCDPIPKGVGWAALLLLAASALAFLPASWFAEPAWRKAFEATGEIALGTMATPQPWHTGQGLAMLAAGIGFGLFLLCQPVNGATHLRLASGFTLGIGIYAGISIYAARTGWRHPWMTVDTFGFLPNRNHAGTLLAMGAAAGLGPLYESTVRKRWASVLPLVLALGGIGAASLFYCESRAAVPLLFAGCLLWTGGVAGRHLSPRFAFLILLLVALAGGAFFSSQAPSKERIAKIISGTDSKTDFSNSSLALEAISPGDFENTAPYDFRLLTYKDTLDLIADHPVTGVGLGNYRYIFPQYRRFSLSEFVTIHADSSWLLIAAESGLPALAACVALVVLACLRLRGCHRHPSWPIRWSSAAAVFIFLFHSLFDIPAHRTATLLPALFLAGLAFRRPTFIPAGNGPPWQRLLFATAGATFLLAAMWIAGTTPNEAIAENGKLKAEINPRKYDAVIRKSLAFPNSVFPFPIPPTVEIEKAPARVYSLYKQNRTKEAVDAAEAALAKTPLASELYFQLGALKLTLSDTDQKGTSIFAAERILEPCLTVTPLRQAALWLPVDPSLSMELFSEAMRRAARLEKRGFADKTKATYERIFQMSANSLELKGDLRFLAGNDPALLLQWMGIAPPEALQQAIGEMPSLNGWSHPDRRRLFRLWCQRGDRKELRDQINRHRDWAEDAWPALAADLALEKKYQEAWRFAAGKIHLAAPARSLMDLGQLRKLDSNPKSPQMAEMLAKALFLKSDWEGVMRMATNDSKGSIFRMASLAASNLNHWPQAWKYLVEAIRREDESFTPE